MVMQMKTEPHAAALCVRVQMLLLHQEISLFSLQYL